MSTHPNPNNPANPPSNQQPKSANSDSSFPGFYLQTGRDNQVYLDPNQPAATRPRGDSIFLPPPIMSVNLKYGEDPAQQYPGGNGNSRSNSIFSSLIQIPGSNGNSVSGPSSAKNPQSQPQTQRPRQLSFLPNSDYPLSAQDLEAYFSKDSLSNVLGWNQRQPSTGQSSKKGQRQPSEVQPNAFWEGLNSGLLGSVAGLSITNDNLNNILAGLSNGGIDFAGMSDEQRRDLILKIINDQQLLHQQRTPANPSTKTKLREDIFNKAKDDATKKDELTVPDKAVSHISPALSLSSKLSIKYPDEPQSPKTSPSMFNASLQTRAPPIQASPQTQLPDGSQQPFYPNYATSAYQYPYDQQFQQPLAPYSQQQYPTIKSGTQFQRQPSNSQFIPPAATTQTSTSKRQKQEDKNLMPVQQFHKSEDGRPLLGATKVDQLMLVIQARDKGNTQPIPQGADGTILGSPDNHTNILPQSANLVGGVDKPEKMEGPAPDEDSKSRKRKQKNQQCPYCFKFFNQSTHLEVHVRSHIGHKPFECSYCHKRFTQGGNLRTHLRLHTGEKPFTCDVCKRSFSRKGNLAAHQLTHKNLKPFECKLDNCDKLFTQLGNLKSHQNRFHLSTLNKLTQRLAELGDQSIDDLPEDEKFLLNYLKKLYKNSNKGIRGRGKRVQTTDSSPEAPALSVSPAANRGQMNFMNNNVPNNYQV